MQVWNKGGEKHLRNRGQKSRNRGVFFGFTAQNPDNFRNFACNRKNFRNDIDNSPIEYERKLGRTERRFGKRLQRSRQRRTLRLQTRRHERCQRETPAERHVPELVSGLRLVRYTGTRRAAHPRRTEACATPHPALHAPHGRRPLQQGGQHRGAHHAVPPPRRRLHRRRAGAAGAERPAHRLPG